MERWVQTTHTLNSSSKKREERKSKERVSLAFFLWRARKTITLTEVAVRKRRLLCLSRFPVEVPLASVYWRLPGESQPLASQVISTSPTTVSLFSPSKPTFNVLSACCFHFACPSISPWVCACVCVCLCLCLFVPVVTLPTFSRFILFFSTFLFFLTSTGLGSPRPMRRSTWRFHERQHSFTYLFFFLVEKIPFLRNFFLLAIFSFTLIHHWLTSNCDTLLHHQDRQTLANALACLLLLYFFFFH